MTKLQKTRVIKWIAALRSGEYKQTTNNLHNADGHCCIGVGECIMLKKKGLGPENKNFGTEDPRYKTLREYFGYNSRIQEKLITLNDVNIKSFKVIATWLEKTFL